MVTVYFDTNFFVWLARERDDQVAGDAIGELNQMEVRHVVALPHIKELFSSRPRHEENKRLHQRISRFNIAPLVLAEKFTWDALLGPPDALQAFSNQLRDADDLSAMGHSHALIADRKLTNEQQDAWNKANPEYAELVLPNGGAPDMDAIRAKFIPMIEALRPLAAALPNGAFDKILAALESASLDPQDIPSEVFAALGSEQVDKLKEEKDVQKSATASDNRPLGVTLGTATDEQQRALAHTYRDAEHMSVFIEHQDQIHYLQIDTAQFNQLSRKRPKHRLLELGLDGRCFAANSLTDAVKKVANLVDYQTNGGSQGDLERKNV